MLGHADMNNSIKNQMQILDISMCKDTTRNIEHVLQSQNIMIVHRCGCNDLKHSMLLKYNVLDHLLLYQ